MRVHRHVRTDVRPVAAVAEREIGALERRVDVERRAVAVFGERDLERHRLGLIAQCEIAFGFDIAARVLGERLANLMRARRFRGVEEVRRHAASRRVRCCWCRRWSVRR